MNAPIDVSFFARAAKPITSYRPYWAKRFGTAPFLPMSRAEMDSSAGTAATSSWSRATPMWTTPASAWP
jgi:hypothetical protein